VETALAVEILFLLVKLQQRWPLVPHLPFLRRHLKQFQTSDRRESLKRPIEIEIVRVHRSSSFIRAAADLCAGCRTAGRFRQPIFRPGWRVQQGQAIWNLRQAARTCRRSAVATNVNGNFFIQFQKCRFRWRPRRFPATNGRLNSVRTNTRGTAVHAAQSLRLVSTASRTADPNLGGSWKFTRIETNSWRLQIHTRANAGGRIFP